MASKINQSMPNARLTTGLRATRQKLIAQPKVQLKTSKSTPTDSG